MEYGISRPTADIDVLDVAPRSAVEILMREGGEGSPLTVEHKVHLHIVGIANPPMTMNPGCILFTPGRFSISTCWSWIHTIWLLRS